MGRMTHSATRLLKCAFALLTLACGLAGAAAPVSEYQLKAVFLFNFAHFVEWPPAALPSDNAPFVIGVLVRIPSARASTTCCAARA